MTVILLEFQSHVQDRNGSPYRARACAGPAQDGTSRWHGWVEFVDASGRAKFRTGRETTQPNREAAAYWASGLTPRYLEGALERALDRAGVRSHRTRTATAGVSSLTAAEGAPSEQVATRPVVRFADVGGLESLKIEIRRIVDTIHVHRDRARQYGIVRNGILLHGPAGCGKTFFAQAVAGEFGLHFLPVRLGSAVSKHVGGAPEAIERLFAEARAATPCLLFFDEFDAVGSKRQGLLTLHEQQMVDALLQQLDAHRDVPGLLIMAATNRFDDLDPAVIREGRFDYKVQIPRPDLHARQAILRALMRNRPHAARIDFTRLAHDLDGFSAAQIQGIVDEAALLAFEAGVPIARRHLGAACRAHAAAIGYGGPRLRWDDLVLPPETMRKLQSIERFIEHPQLVRELGITPPSGVLLFGPPGTGKTTIARVLASETDASFVAVNAADVFSKWLGDSERRIRELFEQARARVPAIVFIDEIDAIADRRGGSDSAGDRVRNAVVNTLLVEMDGIDASARVCVIGATNRPDLLDEALLRPGRLGEAIELGLPDAAGRKALLSLFSKKMRLDPSVSLESLALRTEGASGADLKGLCTVAGRNAFMRELRAGRAARGVTGEDFENALHEVLARGAWIHERRRPVGFQPCAS